MSWPEENDGLRELKRRWDEGHFAEDRHGVHGVDDAVGEAEADIECPLCDNSVGQAIDGAMMKAQVAYADEQFGYGKTCAICSKPSRNHHCDACYKMVRAAAEWVADPGRIPSGDDLHPCRICDSGFIYTQICGTCMDIVLGE